MARIEAVIFDMDGVLVDAKEWHYEALNRALGLFGYTINRMDHLVAYDGLPTRKKLEMLSIDRGLPRGLHPIVYELKQLYTMDAIYAQCKPVFYHEYALARLNALGYRLAVASNSIRDTVDVMLNKCSLSQYLEFSLSNEDVSKPKPDPEIYTTAIQRFGLTPEQCLVVEDNQNGIKAATAAGAHLMAVKTVEDVNLQNIRTHIENAEQGSATSIDTEKRSAA